MKIFAAQCGLRGRCLREGRLAWPPQVNFRRGDNFPDTRGNHISATTLKSLSDLVLTLQLKSGDPAWVYIRIEHTA